MPWVVGDRPRAARCKQTRDASAGGDFARGDDQRRGMRGETGLEVPQMQPARRRLIRRASVGRRRPRPAAVVSGLGMGARGPCASRGRRTPRRRTPNTASASAPIPPPSRSLSQRKSVGPFPLVIDDSRRRHRHRHVASPRLHRRRLLLVRACPAAALQRCARGRVVYDTRAFHTTPHVTLHASESPIDTPPTSFARSARCAAHLDLATPTVQSRPCMESCAPPHIAR